MNLFSLIAGALGGARKLGGRIKTSIVSVLVLLVVIGRWGLKFCCLIDDVRDIEGLLDVDVVLVGVRVGVL